MPEAGDVAVAQFAAVPSWTCKMSDAARVPIRSCGGSGHALTTIVADFFLIGFARYISGLAVDAAVIARVVVEQDVRKRQGLTARWRTEGGRCWNLSCVNVMDVDRRIVGYIVPRLKSIDYIYLFDNESSIKCDRS